MEKPEETLEQFCIRHICELAKSYHVSPLILIQEPSFDDYPILNIIIPSEIIKVDLNDPAFDKPYSELTKTY